jgi:hypothetical protein
MSLLKITPHSFVDLITNSSSELFVCSPWKQKEIEAIKKAIEIQWSAFIDAYEAMYNDKESAYRWKEKPLWGDIFSQRGPYVCKYELNIYCDECSNFAEYSFRSGYDSHSRNLNEYERHSQKTSTLWTEFHRQDGEEAKAETKKKIDRLEGKFSLKYLKAKKLWFERILVDSGLHHLVDRLIEDSFLKGQTRYGHCSFFKNVSPEELEIENEINMLIDWEISCRKGDIFLESAEDNSVPYEFFGTIESMFNATRYHLG